MPEFEIYPSNLQRHKIIIIIIIIIIMIIIIIEQNSPMFSLKLDFRNFASNRETSNGAKKANRSRNTLKVSSLYVLPIKSG